MNWIVLIGCLLVLFGFASHAFVGTRETLTTRTDFGDPTIEKNWYQSFLAWHLVTADLLFSAVLLGLVATTDVIDAKRTVTLVIATKFLVWTVFGLATLLLTNAKRHFRHLYQWIFFLLVATVLFAGASRL